MQHAPQRSEGRSRGQFGDGVGRGRLDQHGDVEARWLEVWAELRRASRRDHHRPVAGGAHHGVVLGELTELLRHAREHGISRGVPADDRWPRRRGDRCAEQEVSVRGRRHQRWGVEVMLWMHDGDGHDGSLVAISGPRRGLPSSRMRQSESDACARDGPPRKGPTTVSASMVDDDAASDSMVDGMSGRASEPQPVTPRQRTDSNPARWPTGCGRRSRSERQRSGDPQRRPRVEQLAAVR